MAKLAILGHATRGKEVIEILEMLGGKMRRGRFVGQEISCAYYINEDGYMGFKHYSLFDDTTIFTLEEFLEKYPYKIGDKVRISDYESEVRIDDMEWDGSEVQYGVVTDEIEWYSAKELNEFNEPNKEEVMENKLVQIKIAIPDGYEFFGIDDDSKIVLTKKQFQYPKTIEECAKVLSTLPHTRNGVSGYSSYTLWKLQQLLICRDAYWKIAGEQMGLGKPWEPDFTDFNEERYGLYAQANKIVLDAYGGGDVNTILTFPTEEMRDAFYENFKELIEECKEFL